MKEVAEPLPVAPRIDPMAAADPFKHVVLLMLEKHSFDQMLGCMTAVHPDLEGIRPGVTYRPIDEFFAQANGDEDTLASFVFIEPKYLGLDQNDDHPPHNVIKAQKLVADVYNATRSCSTRAFCVTSSANGASTRSVRARPVPMRWATRSRAAEDAALGAAVEGAAKAAAAYESSLARVRASLGDSLIALGRALRKPLETAQAERLARTSRAVRDALASTTTRSPRT